jgi:large conductance mechanosensitive channel
VIKEFRDFVLRGNVIELATAVVIGTAFNALVQAVVDNLIAPVIAAAGGDDIDGLAFQIVAGNEASTVDVGAVLSAIISFLITALVVFYVFVRPLNRVAARFAARPDEPARSDEVILLEEIRDLLQAQRRD